jgi:hypothetical protein
MFKLMGYTNLPASGTILPYVPATQYLKSSPPTPHRVVIDRGHVVYMGAIDDTPSTRVADLKTAHNSVAAALDAIAAGLPVLIASTRTYGCSVKYREGWA